MQIWNTLQEVAQDMPLIALVLLGIAGFVLFFIMLQFGRQLLAILSLPTTRTDRLQVGQVAEVKGKTRSLTSQPLHHPATGEPVTFYSIRLAAVYGGADADAAPVEETIDRMEEGVFPFVLQDEGGEVIILHQTYLNELMKFSEKTYSRHKLPDAIKALFPAFAEWTDAEVFKVVTRWLPEGAQAYATGEVVTAHRPDGRTALAMFGGMGAQKDWQRQLLNLNPDARPYAGEDKTVFSTVEQKRNNNRRANKYIVAFGNESAIILRKTLRLLLTIVIAIPVYLLLLARFL